MGWLDERIKALSSFSGSLLGYVGSSGKVTNLASKLGIEPSRILKLDSNENFFIDRDFLSSLLAKVVSDVDLRLYDPGGISDLREALGRYVGVRSECVTLSSGSEQLIDLIARLFLGDGDEVVSVVPSFFMYRRRVELEGAGFVEVPLNGDLSLDIDAILESVNSRTRIVFVCSPNNPTGNQFSWDDIKAIAEGSSALVVLDEAYAEFGDYSAAPLAVEERNVVAVRTFSKAFGLAGLRFGYAVSNPELASVLSEIVPYTISSVVSMFVLELLNHVDVVRKCVEIVRAERRRLVDGLRVLDGFDVFDSKANFVAFRPCGEADVVYDGLLRKGVLVKNLGDLPVIGHCLRSTVGLPYMNDRFLDALS